MAASGEHESAPKDEPARSAAEPHGGGVGATSPPPELLDTTFLCLQCAKCSGLCPAARVEPAFNPRSVVLSLLNATWRKLLTPDSPIWACCVCLSCDEFCPQDVKPHEVVVWLRNQAFGCGAVPQGVSLTVERVRRTGASVAVGRGLARRRQQAALPEFSPQPPPSQLFLDARRE